MAFLTAALAALVICSCRFYAPVIASPHDELTADHKAPKDNGAAGVVLVERAADDADHSSQSAASDEGFSLAKRVLRFGKRHEADGSADKRIARFGKRNEAEQPTWDVAKILKPYSRYGKRRHPSRKIGQGHDTAHSYLMPLIIKRSRQRLIGKRHGFGDTQGDFDPLDDVYTTGDVRPDGSFPFVEDASHVIDDANKRVVRMG